MNASLASHSSFGFSQHSRTFNPPRSTNADAVADEHASRAYILPRRTRGDWMALGVMLLAACAIFFINLTASGYANEFYSAAAQAGSVSWKAFLWGSLDAGNAITVDKPPAALWLMALSVRIFCHPPARSADVGGDHLPALCHRASLLGQLGRHCQRFHLHAHSGSRAHVPLQQPRCLAGATDDRCYSCAPQISGVCQPSFWQSKAQMVDGPGRCSDRIRLPYQATAGAARTCLALPWLFF